MTSEQSARLRGLASRLRHTQAWHGIALLLLLTLLQFGGVLFTANRLVLSGPRSDLVTAEGPYRAFITNSLRSGIFPLWNPHTFSGTPFFTSGEAPLLYPPTWLHCVLPLDKAIDAIVAFHIFWVGLGMYLWGLRLKRSPPAAVVGAVIVMFGGPCFYHVYAGHISNLAAMAWVPFLFLAVEMVMDGDYVAGFLIGSISLAMDILAGQPQYTYYAVFALGIYTIVRLVQSARWPAKLGVLGCAALLGVGVAAIQLFAVLPQVGESIRSGASLSRDFAVMFSLPPENLATAVVPGLFGNSVGLPYWGRYYIWESSMFMGVSGLCMALLGLIAGAGRRKWISAAMAAGLIILAFGSHTPIYPFFYAHFPGFNKFRGSGKFAFDAMLFVALLAAEGFDTLRATAPRMLRAVAGMAFVLAICAGIAGSSVMSSGGAAWWGGVVRGIVGSGASYALAVLSRPEYVAATAKFASAQLFVCCVSLIVVGALLLVSKRRWGRIALLAAVVLEMFLFAHHIRATVDLSTITRPEIAGFLMSHPGDYRVLDIRELNEGMVTGAGDIFGYNSFTLRRYAEFMDYSQGLPFTFDNLSQPDIGQYSPLWRLVRLRYATTHHQGHMVVLPYTGDLPHLLLVTKYAVVHGRDNILPAIADPEFDPAKEVILEQPPVPAPADVGDPGTATLVNENPNRLLIDVDARHPCILLITDSYSRDWKAVARPGSAQSSYTLLAADYVLRAVPLEAGLHHISVEFDPPGLRAGAAVSLTSLTVYFIVLAAYCRRRRHSVGHAAS